MKQTIEKILGKPTLWELLLSTPHGYRLLQIKNNTAYYIKKDTIVTVN